MKDSFVARSSSVTASVLALMTLACAPSVSLQNRPCPCSDGWVCCPSTDVCAPTVRSCSGEQAAGTSGTAGATTGTAGAAGTSDSGSTGNIDASFDQPRSDAGLPMLPNPPYTIQPALQGTWVGYFENFTFPSLSDAIRLSLTQNPDGSGNVSVVLGAGTAPAPPTDPNGIWPPDELRHPYEYVEGVAYDAYEVQWSAGRLKFVINIDEPWQAYCQLQTSYYVKSLDDYRCIPGFQGGHPGPEGTFEPVITSADGGPIGPCITFTTTVTNSP